LPNSITLLSLVIGSSLASSLFFVLSARILRGAAEDNPPSTLGVVAITHIGAALFLAPFLPLTGVRSMSDIRSMASTSVVVLILVTAVLHLTARFFHFKALSLIDVTLVSPFAALTPVLTLSTAWAILGETPNALELVGIFIIVTSLLGLTGATDAFRTHFAAGQRTRSKAATAGLWFAVLSAVPPAFKIAVQKKAILLSSPYTYALIMLLMTGAGALAVCLVRNSASDLRAQFPPQRLRALLLISGLLGLNTLLFCAALTLGLAAGVSAMARISIIFQGVMAYWIAGQKTDFRRRILWAVAIFVGTLIIGTSTS
jgi:drug/metabolite transporter (DMT)-like permease